MTVVAPGKCGCGLPFTTRAPDPFLIAGRWPNKMFTATGGFWYWCPQCDGGRAS